MSEDLDCTPVPKHIEVKPVLPNICLKEAKWCENNPSFSAPAMTHWCPAVLLLFPWCLPVSCLYLIFPIWHLGNKSPLLQIH